MRDCEVIYSNAGGDAEKQQSQAEAALTKGAEVLVVDPMDSKSAAAIAEKAQAQKVPVVSYDRLIENGEVDAYVSFDNERVGKLQAETLAEKLKEDGKPSGPIIMINGDPADPNAALFKEARTTASKQRRRRSPRSTTRPAGARKGPARGAAGDHRARQQRFAGIYAANDDTAGGAIAAMKGAGINPEETPGHRSGRDRRRAPADPRRRAVHDGLQGDRAGGRRSPPKSRSRLAEGEEVPTGTNHRRNQQRQDRCALGAARPDRGDQRQRQEHGGRRRLRHRLRNSAPAPTRRRAKKQGSRAEHEPAALRSSSWRESASDSARSRPWTGSTSRSAPARSSAWSATTAPASRRWSRRSPASTPPTTARSASTARRCRSPNPRTRPSLGIATVYQDLALCDNLDVVANLFLGREEVSPGVGTVSRQLDEARWSTGPASCSPTSR